jgi:hypothetical protein
MAKLRRKTWEKKWEVKFDIGKMGKVDAFLGIVNL